MRRHLIVRIVVMLSITMIAGMVWFFPSNKWGSVHAAQEFQMVINVNANKRLYVPNGNNGTGAVLKAMPDPNDTGQQWLVVNWDQGCHPIINRGNGKVLRIIGENSAKRFQAAL